MHIIVGLGNPGDKYVNTRHNMGFCVIDRLSEQYRIPVMEKKHKALIGKGVIDGHKVVLVKPQTFMNLSGESVREVIDYYKVDKDNELIVIYDDVSLPVGQIRIRKKGSAGGHNGIKSILANLDDDVFLRIKVGVGEKPPRMDLADYVLSHILKEEAADMAQSFAHSAEAIVRLIAGETEEAMNLYNRKPESLQ